MEPFYHENYKIIANFVWLLVILLRVKVRIWSRIRQKAFDPPDPQLCWRIR
jgi:hypothetical protein